MTVTSVIIAVMLSGAAIAQESKPVPKDSVRVFIPGCSKGYVFTVGLRTTDQPGSTNLPEGTHLRMNGPKKTMDEIKRAEGSMIEIAGLMKKDALAQSGVGIGPIRISPGPSPSGGSSLPGPGRNQIMIDIEGWRRVPGACPR
jgi:hypothetical protein